MNKELAVKALSIAGVLVGVGGYLSQPGNLATLSGSTARYVAAAGAVAYVVGQALEHYLTRQQVQSNAVAVDAVANTPTVNRELAASTPIPVQKK